ncbi:antibiotic biosynthesis monooxygenase [Streptococcus sp. 121]|uniref:putative quinol monooxygenase n=1 Tax=Streptococcus sp. 121 TaxID=2797637 RepID=UPI0018F0C2F3|nr:antibiotic biosynthesis monooxygenase [Streptococcus sp. 121]MBJ6745866.1 antibiotic biosynthesis monooxygenase [Streptococcus sp. 121]
MVRVNLFSIATDQEHQALLHEVGVYNLETSHRVEPGTLAMFVAERKEQPGSYVVCEVYQDSDHYEIHRASEQFMRYSQEAGPYLTERRAIPVEPIFLREKLPSEIWIGAGHLELKFAQVEVTEAGASAFEKSVLKNMKTSLQEEEGVLAMYAVKDREQPQVWYFFEVYASPEAYQAHRQTEHFQTYLAETQDLVVDKQLIDLINDASMSQGKLR